MILALTAALVGPFLIDWTVYRDLIEAQAEKLLGEEVKVLGQADVRLLPSPRISLETVRVGPQDAPILTADRVELEVDLSPLLKREIDVVALTFIGPEVRLTVEKDGRLHGPTVNLADGPLDWVDPANVSFDQIDVVDGRLLITDRRRDATTAIDRIEMSGSGRSIHGPFEAGGSLAFEGVGYDVRFAMGSYVAGAPLTVKARIRPQDRPVDFSFDGAATLSSVPASFSGLVTVAPHPSEDEEDEVPVPWRVEGALEMSPNGLEVSQGEVRYGPIERPITASAALSVPFLTDEGFRLTLISRQMDLDGLIKALGKGDEQAVPAERLKPLAGALDALPVLQSDGVVNARLASVVAGGAIVENVSVQARPMPDGWRVVSARADLPGETALSTSGRLTLGPDMAYSGEADIVSQKPGALVRWWRGGEGAAVPVRSRVELDGALQIAGGEISMPAMRLQTGETSLLGTLRYRPRSKEVRGALDLDLRADSLDIRPLVSLAGAVSGDGGPFAGTANLDHDITAYLTAETARYDDVEAGGLTLDATLIDGLLTVDRLMLSDLGGAEISASGSLGKAGDRPSGTLTGHITGNDLGGLARLVGNLAPASPISRRLAEAAPDLAPADLTVELSGREDRGGAIFDLSVGGTLAGTELSASSQTTGEVSNWRAGRITARLEATNPAGDVLMRQLGLKTLPVGGDEPGHLHITLDGTPAGGLDTEVTAGLAGAEIALSGEVAVPADGTRADVDASLKSDDLSVLALALGRSLPLLAGGIPVELSAHLAGPPEKLAVSGLKGSLAGVPISGDGTVGLGEGAVALNGTLSAGEVDLQLLTELVLGGEAWTHAGADTDGWPDAAFGAPALGDASIDLDMTTDRLWVADREVTDATFGLSLSASELKLTDLSGSYAGGTVSATLDLTRSEGQAALSGRFALAGADLAGLVWQPSGQPVATGTLDLAADFEAIGRSVSAMVSALSGSGSFTARDGALSSLNPGALGQVIAAADRGLQLDEDTVRPLVADALNKGTLPYREITGTIGIASGSARIGEVGVDADDVDVAGAGTLDLPAWTLDGSIDLAVAPPDPDLVPDVTADVEIDFSGPLDAPTPTLNVGPLVGYLTLRETEQERRRLEEMERQLKEQQRRQEELLRRLEAERRAEEERQRLEAEAARVRAEEEARLKAEEDARAAAEAAAEAAVPPARPQTGGAAPAAAGTAAGPTVPDQTDPIGSLIDRRFRLLQPEPLGPPIEIGPPPGAGPRVPVEPRSPARRSDAAPASQPFVITPQDSR